MTAYSTNSIPNTLLFNFVDSDHSQRVEEYLHGIIPNFVSIQTSDDLATNLSTSEPQLIIASDSSSLSDIYDYNTLSSTYVLIIPEHETIIPISPFDFVIRLDETFETMFWQIINFVDKKHIEHNSLTDRIDELEAQLSSQKKRTNQVEILKEAIVRNVSHELKTPLLHVKSAVSLMAEDEGNDKKLIRYAENATARLETLVTNITMFGSSLDMKLGPVIIRDAVAYTRRNLSRIWESKDQADRIKYFIDDDLPPVLADRQGISTILQLLLDNALKFSEKDIEVHAHKIENTVEISVRDYGIGIAAEDVNKIFDSFYQIDYSSTRRYGGMGVGLALVKLLTEHQDSEIQLQSEPSKGSNFSFRLKIIDIN